MPASDGKPAPRQPESEPKAYQFIEGKPDRKGNLREKDKENVAKNVMDSQSARQAPTEPPKSPSKPFPSTPAPRLPLADLLGNGDDPRNNGGIKPSPEEQISWESVRSPKSSNSRKTPAPRGTKRARSSSPPTTSQRKSARRDNFDLDLLKNNLKTPRIDPAADLWQRYATNTDKDQRLGLSAASLASFAIPSSPYSAVERGGNVGGFRRYESCGTDFPRSAGKRRKPNHANAVREQVDGALAKAATTDESGGGKGSRSKLVMSLIEQINGSLMRPKEPVERSEPSSSPSSSSPLPEGNVSLSPRKDAAACPSRRPQMPSRKASTAAASATLQGHNQVDVKPPFRPDSLPPSERPAMDMATLDQDDEEFGDGMDMTADDFDVVASLCTKSQAAKESIAQPVSAVPLSDEFGDDDLDEDSFAAAEVAATQSISTTKAHGSNLTPNKRIIQRYLVQNVIEGFYTALNGRQAHEKVLLVMDDKTKLNKVILLRDSWFETRCTTGSYVHVLGAFDEGGQCVIDDHQNILILHPDHLISALVVADSFTCMRKSVLQDRIKATSESSPPLVYGTILHEVFQQAMQANRWDSDWLRSTIESLVARHIEDLYEIKLSVEQAIEHLLSKMPGLQSWAEVFVRATPREDALVKDRNDKQVSMSINKLLDVEEHVWSPMYGLKGNIDATVQIAMQDDEGQRTLTVPFEVKTGKNSSNSSHRAQTALYTLLLSDRYDIAVAYGVLYYMETSEISRIPAIRHELMHMIMQRNELACYVRERLSLPPMVRNTHQCNRCYAKKPCFLYHKLVENGDGETSGLRDKFDAVVRHLTPNHQEFFKNWDDLLTKEETEMMKFKRELWTMLSEEREKLGRCFARVVLDHDAASEEQGASKINRFRYSFRRLEAAGTAAFNESHIAVGEPIVVSDEKGHYALALGYVTQLGKHHISVAVDRRLRNARKRQRDFDAETNQVFHGVMEVDSPTSTNFASPTEAATEPMIYRLDKDEFSNGLASVRNNLIQIMTNDVFRGRELRSMIVDGVEPRFKPASTSYTLSGPLSQLNVNDDQRQAIEKIMSAEDYALVLGMPGTGKTTTIAHIIRALVAKGKSVLLTSYTHTAVDNILLKLRQDNIDTLRLGAPTKIHPEVRDFAKLAAEPRQSIEELEQLYREPQVVATTCLGINHQIFNERIFDYCIVDEASQITLPVCLGPIRMAKTFVLVGDHYQLPPLVQNKEAQQGGLDVSLFRLLSEQHPEAVTTLRTQYRMNDAIMSVSNNLIYEGRLVCGSPDIARKMLELPNYSTLEQLHRNPSTRSSANIAVDAHACPSLSSSACWLSNTLNTMTSPSVIFLNTDAALPYSRETATGARITNPLEATICTNLIRALLLTGLEPSSIGLITLYRSQLALIKSLLTASLTHAQNELLEAHTTDRFQGRDKDVIVLSCVRSNERDIVGELLKDWRRVNVAVTRAKKKLIIVGSRGTLSRGDELLAKMVKLCEGNGWIVDLPAAVAEEGEHAWPVVVPVPSARPAVAPLPTTAASEAQVKSIYEPSQPQTKRAPLQPRQGNMNSNGPRSSGTMKPFKAPSRTGKVTTEARLGGASRDLKTRYPVSANVIQDVLGELQ